MSKAAVKGVIKRSCMRDRIREQLVARILDGSYPPGTRLKELVLAEEFGVSQAPIREALRELEATGLLPTERYCGTRVCAADLNALKEAYELRAVLEMRAVELALPLHPEMSKRFEADIGRMRGFAGSNARDDYVGAALQLHRRLIEACANRVFLRTWDAFHWDVRARITMRHIDHALHLDETLQRHVVLVEHLTAGRVAESVQSVRATFDALISMLESELAAPQPASRLS